MEEAATQVGKLTGTAFWRSSVMKNLQKFTQLNFLSERYTLGMADSPSSGRIQ